MHKKSVLSQNRGSSKKHSYRKFALDINWKILWQTTYNDNAIMHAVQKKFKANIINFMKGKVSVISILIGMQIKLQISNARIQSKPLQFRQVKDHSN